MYNKVLLVKDLAVVLAYIQLALIVLTTNKLPLSSRICAGLIQWMVAARTVFSDHGLITCFLANTFLALRAHHDGLMVNTKANCANTLRKIFLYIVAFVISQHIRLEDYLPCFLVNGWVNGHLMKVEIPVGKFSQ